MMASIVVPLIVVCVLTPIVALSIVPPSITGVLISGLVKVLFVSISAELIVTKFSTVPPTVNQ